MSYYNNTTSYLGCILILFTYVCFSALFGLIFMLLWNWLIPLFWTTAPILTFWQAWGSMILLNLIGNLLFKKNKLNQ